MCSVWDFERLKKENKKASQQRTIKVCTWCVSFESFFIDIYILHIHIKINVVFICIYNVQISLTTFYNSFALLAFWTWHYSTQKVCYFFLLLWQNDWQEQSKRPNHFDLWFQRVQHGQEGMGTQITPSILTGTSNINSRNWRSRQFRSRALGTTTPQTAPPAEDQCSSPCDGGGIPHSNHDGA